jgi:hypothetical protein
MTHSETTSLHSTSAAIRRSRAVLFVATSGAVLASVLLVASCGGGDGRTAATSPTSIGNSTSPHAIHVVAKLANGTTRQLSFGPATETQFATSSPGSSAAGAAAQSLRVGGTLKVQGGRTLDGGGTPLVPPATIEDPDPSTWHTAWTLVWRAAMD